MRPSTHRSTRHHARICIFVQVAKCVLLAAIPKAKSDHLAAVLCHVGLSSNRVFLRRRQSRRCWRRSPMPRAHLAGVVAFDAWQHAAEAGGRDAASAFCSQHFISYQVLGCE